MEAKQAGTSAAARVGRRRTSLDAQGLPEQHDGRPQIPNSPILRELCVPGWRPPQEPQDPSPPLGLRLGGRQPCFTQWESRTRNRYR